MIVFIFCDLLVKQLIKKVMKIYNLFFEIAMFYFI